MGKGDTPRPPALRHEYTRPKVRTVLPVCCGKPVARLALRFPVPSVDHAGRCASCGQRYWVTRG